MKILIIGGTGFIGSYLFDDLCNRYFVERTYATSCVGAGYLYNIKQHTLNEVVSGTYDIIIYNINPLSLSHQYVAKSIEEVCNKCKRDNTWLINISSIFAEENNKFIDAYSMKKHIADEIIMCEMSGNKYTILRFPQIFDYKGLARKSQAGLYFLLDAIKKSGTIPLFANCEQMFRNYLPVELLINAVNYSVEKNIFGLHNVYVPTHTITLNKLAYMLAELNPYFDLSKIQIGEKTGMTYYLPPVSVNFEEMVTSAQEFKYYLIKMFHGA